MFKSMKILNLNELMNIICIDYDFYFYSVKNQ